MPSAGQQEIDVDEMAHGKSPSITLTVSVLIREILPVLHGRAGPYQRRGTADHPPLLGGRLEPIVLARLTWLEYQVDVNP
jgi:hypothetical protein